MQLKNMTLAEVEVRGLFGDRDVAFPVHTGSPIAFLHAPNGAGKTTVLGLVNSLFALDVPGLLSTSFDRLVVTLSDGSTFGVIKEGAPERRQGVRRDRGSRSLPTLAFLIDAVSIPCELPLHALEDRDENPFRATRSPDADLAWRTIGGEHIHGGRVPGRPRPRPVDDRLRDLLPAEVREAAKRFGVSLVGSQRLMGAAATGAAVPSAVVEGDRKRLSRAISRALNDYAEFSQALDRSLPQRFLEPTSRSELGRPHRGSDPRIRELVARRDEARRRLAMLQDTLEQTRDGDLASGGHSGLRELELQHQALRESAVELEIVERELMEIRREAALQDGDLKRQFLEIQSMRQRYVHAGLLEPANDDLDPRLIEQVEGISGDRRDMLALYLGDVSQKLERLEPLARRLELFAELVNEKFDRKRVVIDRTSGYRVISDGNRDVEPANLSSGEQHILVLFFRLLFSGDRVGLFIIDEPELSLHVQWQESLTDDLVRIAAVRHAQFLLATHSPIVVGHHFERMVDLHVEYHS